MHFILEAIRRRPIVAVALTLAVVVALVLLFGRETALEILRGLLDRADATGGDA